MTIKYNKGDNTIISTNFKVNEFDCNCTNKSCKITYIDPMLVRVIQNIRDRIGRPLNINSAYRCKKHNKAVGGVADSQHLLGKAVDLSLPENMNFSQFIKIISETQGLSFFKVYPAKKFIHIDTR